MKRQDHFFCTYCGARVKIPRRTTVASFVLSRGTVPCNKCLTDGRYKSTPTREEYLRSLQDA